MSEQDEEDELPEQKDEHSSWGKWFSSWVECFKSQGKSNAIRQQRTKRATISKRTTREKFSGRDRKN